MADGYAIGLNVPFVAKGRLKRTPTSKENREIKNYIRTHNFSANINKHNGEMEVKVTSKNTIR